MRKVCLAFAIVAVGVLLLACNSSQKPAGDNPQPTLATTQKAEKKDPVLYTGKSCFTRMVDQAQRWAPDALPFHVESVPNSEAVGRDGKATVWKAMFASASKKNYRTFTCSGSRLPDQPAVGISAGPESVYSPNVPELMFHPSYLVTDTDKAFGIAQEKGGKKLLEKQPDLPVAYTADWDARKKQLVWVVIYGGSVNKAKGTGVIDASTGRFLGAAK